MGQEPCCNFNSNDNSNDNFYSCPLESTRDSSQGILFTLKSDPGICPQPPAPLPLESIKGLCLTLTWAFCSLWPRTYCLLPDSLCSSHRASCCSSITPGTFAPTSVTLHMPLLLHGRLVPMSYLPDHLLPPSRYSNITHKWNLPWSPNYNCKLPSAPPTPISALYLPSDILCSYEVNSCSASSCKIHTGWEQRCYLFCSLLTPFCLEQCLKYIIGTQKVFVEWRNKWMNKWME